MDSTQQYIQVGSNQGSSIWGHLLIQNAFADHAIIHLIAVDTLNNFMPYDSAYISDSIGFYYFSNVQPGNYVLLASLTENSIYYGQYAPTYYVDAIMWSDATIVQPTSNDARDIQMVHFLNSTAGNGIINGTINKNLKMSSSGIPESNVEVLLLDQNNKALASTVTNASGFFEFSTLAMGTYTVYPEVAGKTTIPAHITLDAANPSSTVNFTMNQGNVIFGIRDNLPSGLSSISEIYPNPPDGILNLDVFAQKDCSVNMAIYNTAGQLMKGTRIQLQKGSNHVGLDVSDLSKGAYSLNIFSENGGSVSKKFVVVK